MVYPVTLLTLFVAHAAAHGLITSVKGANGVTMPGLSVVDGTFRTLQNLLGQTDTCLMNDENRGPLGTTDGGPVDPSINVAIFMGKQKAPKPPPPPIPVTGIRESIVADTAGDGAKSGLPTPDNSGILSMTWFQVSEDGAGPLNAQLDTTSGGTNLGSFEDIDVTQNIPGTDGGSDTVLTDFPVKVQIPAGTKCTGTIAGTKNLCVVRVRSPAGPWGGSVAFTIGGGANKRSIARRVSRLRVARSASPGERLDR